MAGASRKASQWERNAVPFRVIILQKNKEIGSRECETKAEALGYAQARQSFQSDGIAVIVVDENHQTVFTTEPAKDSNPPRL
jgi:hypothetical protein